MWQPQMQQNGHWLHNAVHACRLISCEYLCQAAHLNGCAVLLSLGHQLLAATHQGTQPLNLQSKGPLLGRCPWKA